MFYGCLLLHCQIIELDVDVQSHAENTDMAVRKTGINCGRPLWTTPLQNTTLSTQIELILRVNIRSCGMQDVRD